MTMRQKAGFALWREHYAIDAALGLRETVFGVLRREKVQDQTFPQISYSTGALLAAGNEGGMSYLLLGSCCSAARLGRLRVAEKMGKNITFQL